MVQMQMNPLGRHGSCHTLLTQAVLTRQVFRVSAVTPLSIQESLYSPLVSVAVLPEYSDELWSEQLRPQYFHLSHISQKPQHVAMQLLLVWKLLGSDHTKRGEYILTIQSTATFTSIVKKHVVLPGTH